MSVFPVAELPANLSSECVQEALQLRCHRHEDGDSLVCARADGGSGAAAMRAVFMAVMVLTVGSALVLNLAMVLTVVLNRKLHTVINYLISIGSMTNLLWTAVPIIEAGERGALHPWLCHARFVILQITADTDFTLIVTVTFLRYLIVIRNQSFPVTTENILLLTAVAITPTFVSHVVLNQSAYGKCSEKIAWTPEDYSISLVLERQQNSAVLAFAVTKYIIGFVILSFCHRRDVGHGPVSSLATIPEVESDQLRLPEPETDAAADGPGLRPPAQPQLAANRGRVDIVATVSMVAFLAIFVVSCAPYIGLILVVKSLTCVLMPHDRFLIWTLVIASGGVKAVLNPLVFVVFSWDFRQAFRQTCVRVVRSLTSRR
ncbi:octopamine receptor beta-1R-like [Pollicipes pollicipes]|uniref:octopamine receptor beta-1R-like n=1 Tax=Pollicipes pollicipes TaxID=41117 RepID=UPI001885122D|nr:octopamine receptor beta-1R-like [Pollicipes pollicipes]